MKVAESHEEDILMEIEEHPKISGRRSLQCNMKLIHHLSGVSRIRKKNAVLERDYAIRLHFFSVAKNLNLYFPLHSIFR